ncbi:MAG: DEAD/DEAH box helicase [Lautropia sp.]|nr:DEAD/DEAH box helicase [Lautropia sp.]
MQPLILSDQITRGVADFLRAAFPISNAPFEGMVEHFLQQPHNLFKGPYLSVPMPFRKQPPESMGKASAALPWLPEGFVPHAHQARAFERLSGKEAQSTLVATGTGSGKTECFLYPILEHCRRQRLAGVKGIKAIILYPMNALASDQAARLAREILGNPALKDIRAGLYVGDEPAETAREVRKFANGSFSVITDRHAMRNEPPDILLTNYKMLDFLLLRADDAELWRHQQPDTLRYLVVDELHTFDGAQGTDLACLVRRLKGRLNTPTGQLVCVGTSATLGSDGDDALVQFASDIFGEPLDADSVIDEDRLSVPEYLADAMVAHVRYPQPEHIDILDPERYETFEAWLAAQVPLWFTSEHGQPSPEGFEVNPAPGLVRKPAWRCQLGRQLRQHFAFQNLLRDLAAEGGKAVPVQAMLQRLSQRLPASQDARYPELWLSSLLALVAHARLPKAQTLQQQFCLPHDLDEKQVGFFLQVKVEVWLRELRRMVASVSSDAPEALLEQLKQQREVLFSRGSERQPAEARFNAFLGQKRTMLAVRKSRQPQLAFHDDLDRPDRVWLPVVHCRDCHVAGWGTTVDAFSPDLVQQDVQGFYSAFFGESPHVRFLFPRKENECDADTAYMLKAGSLHRRLCSRCGTLNMPHATACQECAALSSPDSSVEEASPTAERGQAAWQDVWVVQNLRTRQRNGNVVRTSHRDCPFCKGRNSLSIMGSRAASLSAVMLAQLFASPFNPDKKLIAFSDSVQDAAHRAGFLAARTWQLNLRPAIAQVIDAVEEAGSLLGMDQLADAFEKHWLRPGGGEAVLAVKSDGGEDVRMGLGRYLATFLPPQLHWLHDFEAMLASDDGRLPAGSRLASDFRGILPWMLHAEFGQHAHYGRSLPATGTAVVVPRSGTLEKAAAWLIVRLAGKIDCLSRRVSNPKLQKFLQGLIHAMQRAGAWWDGARKGDEGGAVQHGLAHYAADGSQPWRYRKSPLRFQMLSGPRAPRFITLTAYKNSAHLLGQGAEWYEDWALKTLPQLHEVAQGLSSLLADLYALALKALQAAGIADAVDASAAASSSSGQQVPQVWGLLPSAFLLQTEVRCWKCNTCHDKVLSALQTLDDDLTDSPCRRLGCQGHLVPAEKPEPDASDTGSAARSTSGGYYRNFYRRADIARVVAREHTGLLAREVRETVERRFRSDARLPGDVNVLSATPTLEMGIDIGDLSSVLQCSVPPQQASYIQRAGRAGRSTGNALVMTMATGNAHDLYFWSDPREMVAGQVTAPGVFLNASAVLERQLMAFTLDRWVREGGKAVRIPKTMNEVLRVVKNQSTTLFPFSWLAHVDRRRHALLSDFLALFEQSVARLPCEGACDNPDETTPVRQADRGLNKDTIVWLQRFLGVGVEGGRPEVRTLFSTRVLGLLERLSAEREFMVRQKKQLQSSIAQLNQLPVRSTDDEQQLQDLRAELSNVHRLIKELDEKQTLNVLTDEGLLPNYAFPEQGVQLQSVIIGDRKAAQAPGEQKGAATGANQPQGTGNAKDGDPALLTLEYVRPGSAAITELAPGNTFYAEGRKVVVSQVDVSLTKPEPWRFCRACSYAAPARATPEEACPRCGDPLWPDQGRLRDMLRLEKVLARTLDRNSRIADDSDDRERKFYVRQVLVDAAPEAIRQAYSLPDEKFPFGFEFLDRVTLREVNLGLQDGANQSWALAGQEKLAPGFDICRACGTLQHRQSAAAGPVSGSPASDRATYLGHAIWCKERQSQPVMGGARAEQPFFLYREVSSEGIRLYLPPVDFADGTVALHSLISALQLGISKRFKGAVSHLSIAADVRMADRVAELDEGDEAVGHDARRTHDYLVIYDTVPGGTGYLKELMRGGDGKSLSLREVFDLAWKALEACDCNRTAYRDDGDLADGCYRCMYRYRNTHDRQNISKRVAQRLLQMILDNWSGLEQLAWDAKHGALDTMLQDLDKRQLLDSKLERRFLEALVQPFTVAGQPGETVFRLQRALVKGAEAYLLHAGKRRWRLELQVSLGERQGVRISSRPDFVFWPDDGIDDRPIAVFTDGWGFHKDRVGEDLGKRMALVKSGKFSVWTLGWADVEQAFLQGDDGGAVRSSDLGPWGEVYVKDASAAIDKLCAAQGLQAHQDFWQLPALRQLQQRLTNITHEEHRRLACVATIAMLGHVGDAGQLSAFRNSEFWRRLDDYGMLEFMVPGGRWSHRSLWQVAHVAAVISADQLGHWMKGGHDVAQEPRLVFSWLPEDLLDLPAPEVCKQGWQQMWRLLNMLMPLTQLWAGTVDMPGLPALQVYAPLARPVEPDIGWMQVRADVLPDVGDWVEVLIQAGVEVPEVGFELLGANNRVQAEAELAWVGQKVAVVMAEEDCPAFVDAGWKVFVFEDGQQPDALLERLRSH